MNQAKNFCDVEVKNSTCCGIQGGYIEELFTRLYGEQSLYIQRSPVNTPTPSSSHEWSTITTNLTNAFSPLTHSFKLLLRSHSQHQQPTPHHPH